MTVAIATLNRLDDMVAMVRTLVTQTRKPDQFIVVDAGQGQDLEGAMSRELLGSGIPLTYRRSPKGLPLQRNVAIDLAEGEFVFFFDDDVELEDTYIERALEAFDLPFDPPVGCVTGTLTHPPQQSDLNSRLYRLFGLTHWVSHGQPELYISGGARFITEPSAVFVVPIAEGCRMAFRMEVFAKERFLQFLPTYCQSEDVDFTYRVSKRWSVVQTPFARLNHKVSPTNRIGYSNQLHQLIYAHYHFFRQYREKTPANLARFASAELGLMALAVGRQVKTGQPGPRLLARGMADGWRRVALDIIGKPLPVT
ncbi:MAG: glycosyltransferase family 2 protein [Oligoflexia bacterium]|nr:glycosyltransferase family 2 protein [Oligoflexia bacterium]